MSKKPNEPPGKPGGIFRGERAGLGRFSEKPKQPPGKPGGIAANQMEIWPAIRENAPGLPR
ncbi:MAG: hypothetical protein KF851_09440 [Pirellulaceae bacterium]|nr:hypothetical protein [Pirellulaceae bacterium]